MDSLADGRIVEVEVGTVLFFDDDMNIFRAFWSVHQVVVGNQVGTAQRKDFAIINYSTAEAAKTCIESMHGTDFMDK